MADGFLDARAGHLDEQRDQPVHKQNPAYAKTTVKVVFIPWTNRTQDWTNALSSGKNAPDITELGNTDTPTEASLGMLANITTT